MNLHLSYDEKFLDPFIIYSEQYTASENIYIVIVENNQLKHVVSQNVIVCPPEIEELSRLVNNYSSVERVYFHALPQLFAQLINRNVLNDSLKYLLFYGGEVFGLGRYENKFYLKDTLKLLKKIKDTHLTLSANPIELRRNLVNYKHYKKLKFKKDKEVVKALKNIDYIAHYIEEDVKNYVKPIAPEIKWVNWNYFGADQSRISNFKESVNDPKKILLGNSASPFNNHIDGIKYLRSLKIDVQIIVPLSYGGNGKYIKEVKKEGLGSFGKHFNSLEEFLSPKEYFSLMSNVKAAVYFNLRSQAAGNILWLLSNNIPVFMLEENNLYKMLKANKIHVFSIQKDLKKYIENQEVSSLEYLSNTEAIRVVFGDDSMRKKYKRLLE